MHEGFPTLTAAAWREKYELCNRETLRQLLTVIEEVEGRSLQADDGRGRLISPRVSMLLVEACTVARQSGDTAEVVLRQLLADASAGGEVEATVFSDRGHSSLAARLEDQTSEILADFGERLQALVLAEQGRYEADRRRQREVWDHQWASALHKAEVSLQAQMASVASEHVQAMELLQEERANHHRELTGAVATLSKWAFETGRVERALQQYKIATDEASIHNERAEELLSIVREQSEALDDQRADVMSDVSGILRLANRIHLQLNGAVIMGLLVGFLSCGLAFLVMAEWMVSPWHQAMVFFVVLLCSVIWLAVRHVRERRSG